MPQLAQRAGTTIARASSAYESASRGARRLGAPLAGVLIAAIGAADVLLLDAGTFAASATTLSPLVLPAFREWESAAVS